MQDYCASKSDQKIILGKTERSKVAYRRLRPILVDFFGAYTQGESCSLITHEGAQTQYDLT